MVVFGARIKINLQQMAFFYCINFLHTTRPCALFLMRLTHLFLSFFGTPKKVFSELKILKTQKHNTNTTDQNDAYF